MHVSLKQARLQRYVCFHPSLIVQGQSFFSHLRCCVRRVEGVTVDDHRGRGGGHRTREVRIIKYVAHDLHGQVTLRRLAVAGAANVVVEAVLRALPRRVRGGCGRGGHFLGVCGS